MEIYAKGQLSYLILNCLLERDYYGLDIITEIKERSGGRIALKKPSVYSNLTRMEKQGQVSSYVQNSDIGPNRRYYSITEKGRNTYAELKDYFDRNRIDVFKDFAVYEVEDKKSPAQVENIEEKTLQNENNENDDFFDFSSIDNKPQESGVDTQKLDDGKFLTEEAPKVEQEKQEETKSYNISSLLRQEVQQEKIEEKLEEKVPENSTDNLLQQAEQQTSQVPVEEEKVLTNQEIYDISKDIAKYKRRRSFADDQMAFAVNSPLVDYEEKTKQDIEQLKTSLLENKGKYAERMSEEEFYRSRAAVKEEKTETIATYQPAYFTESKAEKTNDDGVFITGQLDNQTAKARKIEPPRLKVINDKESLPAPKKDSSIDLSHKEIISKLYAKSKGGQQEENVSANYIYDYDDLQDYYSSQGISFNVYEKTVVKEKHNTNKLNLICSCICLVLSLICTAALFTVCYLTGNLLNATNFLYIAFPLLAFAETGYRYYCFKNRTSWEPKPLFSQIWLWAITVLSVGVVIGINFIFGLASMPFSLFCTSLFLPCIFLLVYLPLYYYVKKALYIKLWK